MPVVGLASVMSFLLRIKQGASCINCLVWHLDSTLWSCVRLLLFTRQKTVLHVGV